MAFVVANNEKSVNPGVVAISLASFSSRADRAKSLGEKIRKETDPSRRAAYEKEARELFEDVGGIGGLRSKSEMRWPDLATLMPFSDIVIAEISYDSKGFSDYVLSLLSGLLEVARGILLILLIGSIARAAKDHDVSQRSTMAMIGFSIATGVCMLVWLIIRVITEESSKPSTNASASKSGLHWFVAGAVLVYLIHLGSLVFPAVLSLVAKNAAVRRAR